MKKSWILAILILGLASAMKAQLINSLEVRTGGNWAKPVYERGDIKTFPNSFDADAGLTIEGTVFSKIDKDGIASIGTGIHFMQAIFTHTLGGIITDEDITNGTVTELKNKVTITNIGVPVLMRYDIGKSKKWSQIVGGLGFYKTFNKVSETITTGGGLNDPVIRGLEIEDIANGFNISAQIGLRALLAIGKRSHINIGGKIEYFLLNDNYYFEDTKGNLLSFGASLGYMFNL
ncbi:MAG: hypothetical protein IT258_20995 [Saprospiraceae bacterium]|nr:hypothetical protein [Saprospiraceae bacterium]